MSRPLSVHLFTVNDVSANVLPYTVADKVVSYGPTSATPATKSRGNIFFDTTANNAKWATSSSNWVSFDRDQSEVVLGTSRPATLTPGVIYLDVSAAKPYWATNTGSVMSFAAEVTAPSFAPSDMGYATFWIDPSNNTTPTYVSGTSKVSELWTYSATPLRFIPFPTASTSQPTIAPYTPTGGSARNWLIFNGNTGLMATYYTTTNFDPVAAGFTQSPGVKYAIFLVGVTTASVTDAHILSIQQANNATIHVRANGSQLQFYENGTLYTDVSNNLSTNTWSTIGSPFIACIQFRQISVSTFERLIFVNGRLSLIRVNNVTATTVPPQFANRPNATIVSLGMNTNSSTTTANNRWTGAMGEVLVVYGDHAQNLPGSSIAGRHKIEGYLAHKWKIASVLPSAHPYKNSPP